MGKRWLPLEANPDVMNQFMWELGVPEYVGFCDVYGLDDEMLATVPQPVLALLLLYPQDRNKESQALAASSVETKEPSKNVYFTKQTIGNACGTVGIIHALGNAASRIKLAEGSYFDRFYKRTADMDPTQRAAFLEENEEMENAHYGAVTAGDTEVKDGVIEHYVCFSCVDGELYELDGGKSQPIYHGPSSPDTFLQDAAKVIKARIAEYPHSNNFNVMALSSRMNPDNSEQPDDEIPGFCGGAPVQGFHGGWNPRLHRYPYFCGIQQHPSTGFMPFPVQPSSPAAPAQNQTSPPPAVETAMCPGPAVMKESQGDGAGGSVTTGRRRKVVASRIKLSNFSPKEDVFLVKSWLELRFGPIINRGLKGEGLWSRIMSRYNEKRGRYPERSIKSLQSRWEHIKAEGAKFAVYVANVLRDNPSGMSDADKTSLAQANFADVEQYPFAYMHCWDLLKDEPKWMEINHKRPRISDDDGIRDHIPPTSNNIDLDPEIPSPNSSGAKRPMGRDAANAAANKSASSSAPASSSQYASKLRYPCFNGFQQHPSSGLMLVPVQPSSPAAPAQNQTSPPAVETAMCPGPAVMIESQGDGAGGSVPTGRRRKVVASRIKLSNFSQKEDVFLVNSWLEIRCGPILNRGLKREGLWRRIMSRYNKKRGRYPERSIRSLQSRWEHIKAEGAKFAVYVANVLRDNPCGMSDAHKISLAQANFADVEQYSFAYMHCWDLLKDEPKWLETSHKGPRHIDINGIRDIIPHTSNTIDLDREIPSPNSSGAQRPVGRDAANAAANKSASSSASASSSQHASKLQYPYFNCFQQHPSSRLMPLPVQPSSPAAPAQNQTSPPPAVETEMSPEPAVMKESQEDGTGGSVPTGGPCKVVASRIKLSNFSPKEDVFLVKSWLEIKRGPIINSGMKREGFWSRIRSRYNEKRGRYPERSIRSLQSRWEHIKAEGAKFAVYVANVLRDNPSGMSNADKISLAQANFANVEQYPFAYMHCWDLLKHEPKWMGRNYEGPRHIDDDGIRDHIPPTSNTIDLDPEIPSPNSSGAKRIDPEIPSPNSSGAKRIDPEIPSPNSSGAKRPTGRDAANAAANKSASSSASASSSKLQDLSVQDISVWQEENIKRGSRNEHMSTIDEKQYEELRKYNESMYKLEQQKMQFEQEKLQLMREKLEMQRRKEEKLEEERILGINLDSCPPPLRVYYQAKQEEILRKIEAGRSNNSGQ